jgi:hypothetical protein
MTRLAALPNNVKAATLVIELIIIWRPPAKLTIRRILLAPDFVVAAIPDIVVAAFFIQNIKILQNLWYTYGRTHRRAIEEHEP